jgi:hypothetical protein
VGRRFVLATVLLAASGAVAALAGSGEPPASGAPPDPEADVACVVGEEARSGPTLAPSRAARTHEPAPGDPPGSGSVSIEGVVVDESGAVVPGATVYCGQEACDGFRVGFYPREAIQAETDDRGRFSLRGPERDGLVVVGEKRLDGNTFEEVRLRTVERVPVRGLRTTGRLVLVRQPRVLLRMVTEDGTPHRGWWHGFLGPLGESGSSDGGRTDDGRVRFSALAPGEHHLQLQAEGFAPSFLYFRARPREDVHLGDVPLDRGVVIGVQAVDSEGRIVSNACMAPWQVVCLHPDDDGTTWFRAPRGRLRVRGSAPGFVDFTQVIDVREGDPPHRLRIDREVEVRLRVRLPDGREARGQPVRAVRSPGEATPAESPVPSEAPTSSSTKGDAGPSDCPRAGGASSG